MKQIFLYIKFILVNYSLNIPARARDPWTLPPGRPTVNSISLLSSPVTNVSSGTGDPQTYNFTSEAWSPSRAAIRS